MKYLRRKFVDWLASWLTEEELYHISTQIFSPGQNGPDKDVEEELFNDLAEVDNFDEYLRNMMFRDMRQYFSAQSPRDQIHTKGAYSRAMYIKSRLVDARKDDDDESDKSFNLPTYWSN